MRLKSVDLPTFGRPTMATSGFVVSVEKDRTGELSVEGLNEIGGPSVQNAKTEIALSFDADHPESLL